MHAESDARFTIRRYQPGDERQILDLFARSFHEPRSIDHWRWKYEDDPYGSERISVAFDGSGALVAHYAGYPVRYFVGGEDVLAHQIGDTMTEASIRHIGRGPSSLLGRTAMHFYETFCDRQVAFNYGFNVSNIQKFSLQFLRSTRVEQVFYRARDLTLHPLPTLRRWERYARGITLEAVSAATGEWDELFARAARHYEFLVRRDAQYVTWRYFSRPDVEYVVVAMRKWRHLAGWLVLRLRGTRMSIGDLFIDPDLIDVLEPALRHLAHAYRAETIDLWCPPRPAWLHETLVGLGFEHRPEPQDLSVMCVPFVDTTAPQRMAQSLFYMMGDSDLF